jgi:HPt (histidine-containing phosphotransfer) domain-containing protein
MTRAPDLMVQPAVADTETLQFALQMVLSHLQQVDMAMLDAPLATRLSALAQACTALDAQLHRQPLPAITAQNLLDHAVFDRLMVLAGPETARDLLDRLVEDLQSVQQNLNTARHPPVWEALRTQSHILIGLAGAVGAHGLHKSAQDLNDLANDPAQQPALDPLLSRLTPTLAALIHFVQAQRTAAVAAQ